MTQDAVQLAGRVEKLEKQNRRLQTVGVIVVLVASAALLMGQASLQGKTIEAQEFLVKDLSGRVRMKLGMDGDRMRFQLNDVNEMGRTALYVSADGEPAFMMFGEAGAARLLMALGKNQPGLLFQDQATNMRAGFFTSPDGSTSFCLSNNDLSCGVGLGIDTHGYPNITLTDPKGTLRLGMGLTGENGTELLLADKEGKERATLQIDTDGKPRFELMGGDGYGPRISLGIFDTGGANLSVSGANTNLTARLGVEPAIGSFAHFTSPKNAPSGYQTAKLGVDEKGRASLRFLEDREPFWSAP